MGFWVILIGSPSELLDGTLKLRFCTTMFTTYLPPWSLPRIGDGGGKRQFVTPGHLPDEGSIAGKRVRLTRKTRPGASSYVILDPGHPTPRRWKRLRSLSSEGGSEVGVPRNLSPRLGVVGEVCTGDAWNMPSEGQSSQRDKRTGAHPFPIRCT